MTHADSCFISFKAYQVASGLQHLHDRLVVHGDLRAVWSYHKKGMSNEAEPSKAHVLIDDEGNARLTGFHLSSILPPLGAASRDLQHGSNFDCSLLCYIGDANPVTTAEWRWRAPEILTGFPDQSDLNDHAPPFTRQTDVYSFGMTVYEVHYSDVHLTAR